jgi:hypothetical protein
MKLSRCLAISTVVTATAAIGLAAAWAADSGRGAAPPSSPLARGATAPAPLKGDLRVNPAATNLGATRAITPATNVDALTQKFSQFSGNAKSYEYMAKSIPGMVQGCSAKSYSVQDQQAAGCTASDTVALCSDKLLKYCLANLKGSSLSTGGTGISGGTFEGVPIRSPGSSGQGSVQIGFSIKEFQQAAQSAAVQARAMSQLLNLYAGQVEQSAKALLP